MPGNKSQLISAFESIFSDLSGKNASQKATEMGDAIDSYVDTIKVSSGISVQVDPNTGSGATTGIGNLE